MTRTKKLLTMIVSALALSAAILVGGTLAAALQERGRSCAEPAAWGGAARH